MSSAVTQMSLILVRALITAIPGSNITSSHFLAQMGLKPGQLNDVHERVEIAHYRLIVQASVANAGASGNMTSTQPDCTVEGMPWANPGKLEAPELKEVEASLGKGVPFDHPDKLDQYQYSEREFFFSGKSPAFTSRFVGAPLKKHTPPHRRAEPSSSPGAPPPAHSMRRVMKTRSR